MIDSCEEGWVEQVIAFIDKFYRRERRTAIRMEALNHLGKIVAENSLTHEVRTNTINHEIFFVKINIFHAAWLTRDNYVHEIHVFAIYNHSVLGRVYNTLNSMVKITPLLKIKNCLAPVIMAIISLPIFVFFVV